MALRGHEPIVMDKFNGLWDQGDVEEVPIDHFSDCENIRFVGSTSFATRYGVDRYQNVAVPLGNIVRMYNYVTQTANTLLVLVYTGGSGSIYHVVDATSAPSLVLTKAGMTDFAFVGYAGRAYISPIATYSGVEKGMQNETLYVYLGAGSPAQVAGVTPPVGTITVANGAAGNTDAGLHLFGVVFESNTGALSAPAAFDDFTTGALLSVSFSTVPTGAANVTKRHIVATKVITGYTGNTTGYQYYFIPNATINDNVTTTLANISFFDADLLEDASYLLDSYSTIPAGCGLSLYHNRLVLNTTFDDINLVLVSAPGDPESISQIDGLLVVPPDGNAITCTQELRDVLYVFKRNKTVSFIDNDDVPSSWPLSSVDQSLGCPLHGIGVVIDSGGSSVDYLLVASSRGIIIFNGRYILPELSWKISEFWLLQDKTEFRRIQIANDAVNQLIWCTLPDRRLLMGDYTNGFDPMKIRWAPVKFDFKVNAIALHNIDTLLLASEGGLSL